MNFIPYKCGHCDKPHRPKLALSPKNGATLLAPIVEAPDYATTIHFMCDPCWIKRFGYEVQQPCQDLLIYNKEN